LQIKAEERFKIIQNAYDILIDPQKRADYDKKHGFWKDHVDVKSNSNRTRSHSESTQPYPKPRQYTPSQVSTEPHTPDSGRKPNQTVRRVFQKRSAKDLGKLNIIKSLLVLCIVGGIGGAITANLVNSGSGGTGEYLFIMLLYFFQVS
jgi:curved DNA-binding protein CbpA